MNFRPMTESDARGILRDAVRLNITDAGRGTRFATERDELVNDLRNAGFTGPEWDVNSYSHPMDV
jgi:hypothetical protein